MANKLIDRSIPVDVAGVEVAIRILSMRESMRLRQAWELYFKGEQTEQRLVDCLAIAVENYTPDELLETFTATELYGMIGRSLEESALTGLERKKPQSSPLESAESSADVASEGSVSTTSGRTTT